MSGFLQGPSMASALSPFMQQSAWPRLPSDQQSKDSEVSSKTIQRPSSCKPSHGSARSLGSSTSNKFCAGNENKVASRRTSHCSLPLATTSINFSLLQRTTKEASPKQSWENDVPLPYDAHGWSSPLPDVRLLEDIDLHAESGADRKYSGYDIESDHVDKADYGSSLDIKKRPSIFIPRLPRNTSGEETEPRPFVVATDHPFKTETNLKNWISTLRPQGPKRKGSLKVRKERWTLDDFDEEKPVELGLPQRRQLNGHQKASSWSSSGLLTALKSATVRHGAPKTKPQTAISPRSHFKGSNRSSIASDAAHRASIGSGQASSRQLDHAAWDRAVQRRKILEELVSSEESYVADLKVLLHVGSPNDLVQEVRATDEGSKVYLNLLESTPKMTQPELSQNVADMLRLHEEILAQIKRCLPDADLQSDISVEAQEKSKIGRWGNVDNAEAPMGRKVVRMAWRSHDLFWFGHHKNRTLVTAPGEAADVARIFERMLVRFFVYEEYGAKYESMLQNMAALARSMPKWSAYERGIEALVNSLVPQGIGAEGSKKGLTYEDLLIKVLALYLLDWGLELNHSNKPIQRVCRYPLLFADLCMHTPITDGLESSSAIEKVLSRLRETAKEINKATNDEKTQARIQRSWHLQDLLVFPELILAPVSLRLLGHALLCGVLYVAYQSKNGDLRGDYMLCASFKSYLLLALPKQGMSPFEIMAIINHSDIEVVKADSGRGLQCHTAPFAWKIMFEVDQQLYEIIFCACSIREEEQWRAELLETPFMENQGQAKSDPVLTFGPSVLPLDIKALGYVFGQPGTLTRRQSIQRAATVKWRKNGLQVIIKNTNSLKDIGESPVSGLDSLSRSQSLPSTNRVPILAPKRAERQRMEQIMSDVWTRERLPYPGMTGNKGGYLIRTSATSVMRKLSRASMTTTSTKRTVSFTSNAEIDLVSCLEESVDEHLDNEDAKIQRKVSYVSMSDAGLGPGRVRIQRVTQTDGASSPPPEFGYGRVGSRLEDQDMADLQLDGPPPKDRVVGRHRERCEASKEATTDRSAEPEHVEGKVRKPRTLLKAFSAEGIRALFR